MVNQDQVDLAMGNAEHFDGILDRRLTVEAVFDIAFLLRRGEEVVEFLVKPKIGPVGFQAYNRSDFDVYIQPAMFAAKRLSLPALFVPLILIAILATAGRGLADESHAQRRAEMIHLIEADVRRTSVYLKRSALDPRVLEALAQVPRHEFVPSSEVSRAYQNRPLPIGHGQTISQPYIVAIMTDLLGLEAGARVLEIGTGSGYQAAVLAALDTRVWTIEIIEPLGLEAAERLQRLGYDRIETRIGDGYYGWPEAAPFDAIVVTAAASHVPPPLIKQLQIGGKMIIPVGSRFSTQELILVTRVDADRFETRLVLPVRFVPLTGGH